LRAARALPSITSEVKDMDVHVTDRPELRVGALPHIGPYQQIGETFRQLGAIAGSAGLFNTPGAAMLAIYYDDPDSTPPDRLRSDAAVAVPDGVPLPAGLTEKRIPGGRYARTEHVGPYEGLSDTWTRFKREGLPAVGQRRDGASYEVYVNDPMKTPKHDLRTELYIPLT
jgi:AraC family transcriptional regulator